MSAKPAHATHHHHTHNAKGFVREVAAACTQRGLRLTEIRLQVLELIAASDKPVKAYDLLDRLKDARSNAAPPTVYRALDFLIDNGFIHKLQSINAYVSCHHPSVVHQVPFLICDVCESATEICDERVSGMLADQARSLGFRARAQTLEVHGVCRHCSTH
ncbi:MAG: transcriptional repressor [Xanthomonadaceae bacterium]|nr:transcriptional repressor [Xanthomonadaceae bacterium]MDE1885162.1 transcriptional repressor [Xanthomonadaceae bacterium]MDE2084452.1 transcriptional repressor [Xanthomonadaceae bacterium]MDE2257302.1 transcriptional repressor [Xanthomonadaceae bacterium]